MVGVGDIVLFRISPETCRPLLVTHVEPEGVDGELFLNWHHDRASPWCVAHAFYLPSKEARQLEVFGAKEGEGIGEWQEKRWRRPPKR